MPIDINLFEEPTEPPNGCISSSPSATSSPSASSVSPSNWTTTMTSELDANGYTYFTINYPEGIPNTIDNFNDVTFEGQIDEWNFFEYKEPTLIEHYKRRNNKLSGLAEFCKTHYGGG